ncbi:MAG: hypothetical protein H6719_19015 [Sandaracinaceae bacterium]|nr:hypothetical protein [Sandaracinaceae bacterium]
MLRGATSGSRGSARLAIRIAALAALAAILAHGAALLAGPPVRGLADNGDFWRVGRGAGLWVPDDPESRNRFVRPSFERADGHLADAFSSAALLVRIAGELPPRDPREVSLQRVGLFYLCLAALAFTLALRRGAAPLVCVAFAWVLASPENLLMLNSLYADAAALLGALVIALSLVRRPGAARWVTEALLLVGVFLATWSKQLHAGVGVAAALASMVGRPPGDRVPTVALLAGLVTFGAVVHFGAGAGLRFPTINGYHAVFSGVADVSSDPDRVLREHHLSEYRDRVGTHYFGAPVPPDLARRVETVSRTQIALQYLRDPRALRRTFTVVRRALVSSDRFLGNELPSERHPGAAIYEEPWSFGALRDRAAAALPFVAILALAWLARRRRPWRPLGRKPHRDAAALATATFLVLTIAFESAGAVLGDGFFALGRHLHLARFALDLLLAFAIASAIEAATRKLLGPASFLDAIRPRVRR